MRGFTWSIFGSVISVLIISLYVSLFNYALPIYMDYRVKERAEEDARAAKEQELRKSQEEIEARLDALLQEKYEAEVPAQLQALGMIFP